ncbi:AT hook, DNA-binding motif protein [Sesbania bispinosa]|nr:AT hook, DNA-binding motif protein [Sesbania bispinosa]
MQATPYHLRQLKRKMWFKGRPKKTSKQPGGSQEPSNSKPQKRKITATETTVGETQRPSTSKKQKAKLVPRKAATGIQIVEPPIMPSLVLFFESVLAQVVHVSNLWHENFNKSTSAQSESIGGTTVQGEAVDIVARVEGLDTEQGSMSTTTAILEQDTVVGAGTFEPPTEFPPKKD